MIPETHASEPQKQKTKKTPSIKPHPSYSKRRPPSTSSPWAATPTQSFSGGAGARQQQQQEHHYTQADPANFFAPPPPPPPHQHHQDGGADLERLERQALRRRKVEALESISHTAALFLAEFMTFANRQISSASSEGAIIGEPDERGEKYSSAGGSVPAQNCGMDYAAAAAEMAVRTPLPFFFCLGWRCIFSFLISGLLVAHSVLKHCSLTSHQGQHISQQR